MKKAEFILAGCSVSSGVPAIGNDWGKCDPNEPKNRRDRPCAIVRTDHTTLVIDTGPDFRS
ncbi:MAG: MBL fold metallo-hydrolase, partial [Pseudomonadota bacterium]|nr:MBL fold metallo-hydrolase [Pseudomonadota bacterium]